MPKNEVRVEFWKYKKRGNLLYNYARTNFFENNLKNYYGAHINKHAVK